MKREYYLILAFPIIFILQGCGDAPEPVSSTQGLTSEQSETETINAIHIESDSAPRQITVSPETTFVEGPLNEKGVVDFVHALNEITDPKVAPDQNAALALCQVLGSGQPDQTTHAQFLKRIGGDSLPMGETGVLRGPESPNDAFINQQGQAMSRPWTADEFPQIAAWVERIGSDLDACILAVERPVFYLPLIDTLAPEEPLPPLMSVLMPIVQSCRGISRGLSARAMQKIADGDEAGARRDILAMFRLARHLSNAPVSIQSLIGVVTESQANRSVQQLLNSGLLNEQSTTEWLAALADLPPFKSSVETLETGERLTALDVIQAINTRGPQSLSFLTTVTNVRLDRSAVDWNTALQTVNDWYDQMVTAVRTPDYPQRLDAIDVVEQRLQSVARGEAWELGRILSGSSGDPQAAGQQLGNLVAALTIPAATQVHIADTRREMQTRLTILALELFRYRESHGEFPSTLGELEVEIPSDLFTLNNLIYRRDEGSITVYSLGPNRIDDGGPNPDAGSDDIGFVLLAKTK